ncbi:hypothetical protein COV20_06045 [Candidatus Woesearchaeota archaeon CG10_big_fil_rev_8_21_14_0_10_45_16]|nr:MAG: hypothetical protein COV20_06045 [Candidatus Woesearchaeota archaeon CG10_big_fil_rev_8_21_14_0_10_45_16]
MPNIREILTITGIVAGAVAFVASGVYALNKPIYEGPINVPGVNRVVVSPEYMSHTIDCLHLDGTTVNVFYEDGSEASVRDYNGNFQIDGKDTVQPSTKKDLPAILEATAKKGLETGALRITF